MTAQTIDDLSGDGTRSMAKQNDDPSSYCPFCGIDLMGGAKFCHGCGVSVSEGRSRGPWNVKSLTVLGAAATALVVIGTVFALVIDVDKKSPGSEASTASFVDTAPATGQPPDLSTMTPREAADRLFNRVMRASEQGNVDEAQQFVPMALQAYDMLGTLDLDAHYHIGRLQETAGDLDATEATIETIRATAPNHLLASLLEHNIAVQRGDEALANQAATAFLDAYDDEIAQGRREYNDHSTSLDKFQSKARNKLNRSE